MMEGSTMGILISRSELTRFDGFESHRSVIICIASWDAVLNCTKVWFFELRLELYMSVLNFPDTNIQTAQCTFV